MRERSPGACNGYPKYIHCRFGKYRYDPERANFEYKEMLVDSRLGVNLTYAEAKKIGDIPKFLFV